MADERDIRELIEAGRYPKDEAGRAIVLLRCGAFATVTSTNLDGPKCIGGFVSKDEYDTCWHDDGRWSSRDGDHQYNSMLDIMPPGYVAVWLLWLRGYVTALMAGA